MNALFAWFLRRRGRRQDLCAYFQDVSAALALTECAFQKYPVPAVSGKYFGFRLSLEGRSNRKNKTHPYKIKGVVHLPQKIEERIYLHHESRPASFKPIATLQLVHTHVEHFDRQFLLLASNEHWVHAIFQPYLCQRFLSLQDPPWILDLQQEEAHLEFQLKTLDSAALSKSLQVVVECLNTVLATVFNKESLKNSVS